MKVIRQIAIFSLFAILLVSCREDDPIKIENVAELDSETVSYDNTGQFLTIKSGENWSISFYYDDGVSQWCSATQTFGSGDAAVGLNYAKNSKQEERSVTITIYFGEDIIERKLTQGAAPEPKPEVPEYSSDPFQTSWPELATLSDKDSMMFVSHYTTVNNKSVRNYSMMYDLKNKYAHWIAYPLSADYTEKNVKRSDAWEYDPKIPKDCQPTLYKGWGVGGYDRGHQLPSADRLNCYKSNAATFYFTNMTAQNSNLNQGVWMKLEDMIRDRMMPRCDTLYVVTGAVHETEDDKNTAYIKGNYGESTAIPKAYYKVLLKFTKPNSYSAIGFWYDNKSYGNVEPNANHAQTVDEIEKRTGYDFFTNLPKDVQDKIEAEFKPTEWLK